MCCTTWKRAATSLTYPRISPCPANTRDQSGFCAKENEYIADGTSQAHPGYVLARQVPPCDAAFSRMMNSFSACSRKRTAAPIPLMPAPIITTCFSIIDMDTASSLLSCFISSKKECHTQMEKSGYLSGPQTGRSEAAKAT